MTGLAGGRGTQPPRNVRSSGLWTRTLRRAQGATLDALITAVVALLERRMRAALRRRR